MLIRLVPGQLNSTATKLGRCRCRHTFLPSSEPPDPKHQRVRRNGGSSLSCWGDHHVGAADLIT